MAAVASGATLVAAGALHLLWGSGSSWPLQSRSSLAVVVSGSPTMPGAVPCVVIGGGLVAAGSALVVRRPAGLLRLLQVLMATGLAGRAAVGGRVATHALGLPAPAPVFLSWDRRCYRPLCAVLAVGILADVR